MRTPIPQEVRDELENEPRMKRCALSSDECSGELSWHHWFRFVKKLSLPWCLLALCKYHHDHEAVFSEKIKWIGLNLAPDEDLIRFSKAENYIETRKRLNKIYAQNKN